MSRALSSNEQNFIIFVSNQSIQIILPFMTEQFTRKTISTANLRVSARVIFKRNSWLVVMAENVKIQYFIKKIFNSYVYISVDNDTMKIQKEI